MSARGPRAPYSWMPIALLRKRSTNSCPKVELFSLVQELAQRSLVLIRLLVFMRNYFLHRRRAHALPRQLLYRLHRAKPLYLFFAGHDLHLAIALLGAKL